jgi:hypothetical protein
MATTGRETPVKFHAGNAPYGMDAERRAPSRGPRLNSLTTIGSGTVIEGYGGRGVYWDGLSNASDEDDRHTIRGTRPSELPSSGFSARHG